MSFFVKDWATAFSPAFHEDAKAMLETALNKVCCCSKVPVPLGRVQPDFAADSRATSRPLSKVGSRSSS